MVRPLAQHLYECLKKGLWPEGPAAVTDYGLDSDAHFDALSKAVANGEITLQDLDAALGNGALLTKLVRQAPSNPNKTIVFHTPWDEMKMSKGPSGN